MIDGFLLDNVWVMNLSYNQVICVDIQHLLSKIVIYQCIHLQYSHIQMSIIQIIQMARNEHGDLI